MVQDTEKTHQVQRSIINVVSGCGRTDSYLKLHLNETFLSFTVISMEHTGDSRDVNPLSWFNSQVPAHCISCLVLGGIKYLTNYDHDVVEKEAAFGVVFIHTIKEQI